MFNRASPFLNRDIHKENAKWSFSGQISGFRATKRWPWRHLLHRKSLLFGFWISSFQGSGRQPPDSKLEGVIKRTRTTQF